MIYFQSNNWALFVAHFPRCGPLKARSPNHTNKDEKLKLLPIYHATSVRGTRTHHNDPTCTRAAQPSCSPSSASI